MGTTPKFLVVAFHREAARLFPSSKSHVFNAGAPVWALDWCPTVALDRASMLFSADMYSLLRCLPAFSYRQYLAVAPLPSGSHSPNVGVRLQDPTPACIQVWSLGPSMANSEDGSAGILRCDLVLGVDSGPALDLKWCPLPSHDAVCTQYHSYPTV